MTAADFRLAIIKLGMTPTYTSRFFGMGTTAGARWSKEGPPDYIAIWLEFMLVIQRNLHIKDVPVWINAMIGRKLPKRQPSKRISP